MLSYLLTIKPPAAKIRLKPVQKLNVIDQFGYYKSAISAVFGPQIRRLTHEFFSNITINIKNGQNTPLFDVKKPRSLIFGLKRQKNDSKKRNPPKERVYDVIL